nr:MAG TPA: stabilization protein [Caudoviricetes sp.]
MRFKPMQAIGKSKQMIGVFGGLNQSSVGADNEFLDMKNVSSRLYPSLTLCEQSVPFADLSEPFQFFWKNDNYFITADTIMKQGENGKRLKLNRKDLDRTLVGMGAYICIFPDKQVYNTATGELLDMEASYTQSGSISIAPVSEGSSFVKIQGTNLGKAFKKDDVVTLSGFTQYTDVLNGAKAIKEIGDNFIVITAVDENGAALRSITEESGVKIERKLPDLDFVCEFNNRLWGCSSANHEIYASKLGDPTNWNSYQGTAADSYAVSVGSDGDFTGVISQQGYVVFFKEDYIHTIYGTKPSNFSLDTVQARGVMKGCSKSLCHVNETVMYVGRDAIMAYTGGMPESVSDKLNLRWSSAVANQWKGKYYVDLTLFKKTTTYVYDLVHNVWMKEDEHENKLLSRFYANGILFETREKERHISSRFTSLEEIRTGDMDWYLESVYLEEGTIDQKKVHSLQFNVELEVDAYFAVYVRYDNDVTWRRVASVTADRRNTYTVPLKLKKCERYQYRLEGHGWFILYGMSKTIGKGSER